MKHHLSKIKVVFLLLLLFQSCTKQVEIEFPEMESELAVSCLFTVDSVLNLSLFRTSDFNDSIIYPVKNAECKLLADGKYVENLIGGDEGFYVSPSSYKPQPNVNYSIEISHADYPTIFAADKLPEAPQVLSIIKQDSVMYDEDGEYLSSLFVTLKDNPNTHNYYEIKVLFRYKKDYSQAPWIDSARIDTNIHVDLLRLRSRDIVLQNEGLLDYYPATQVFSDELFNGQTYTLKVDYVMPLIRTIFNGEEYSLINDYQLIIYLHSVSENYYKYKKKLIIHIENQYSDVWSGVGEPIDMFSNVEGGYGIFAGYTTYLDTIHK